MTEGSSSNTRDLPSKQQALLRTAMVLLPVWVLLGTLFWWAKADSTRPPYFQLDGGVGQVVYWITESGGPIGATVVAIACSILFVRRAVVIGRAKRRESLVLFAVIGICAGAGAGINEYLIKEYFESPRPNIRVLTGSEQLAAEFYQNSPAQRGERIGKILSQKPIALSPNIKYHWMATTGYSFPSGHSFSALFFATFFVALAISHIQTRRMWVFYLLVPWALAVCYSRTILRVHTPTDINVGALQGMVVGAIAFWIVHGLLDRARPEKQVP